MNLRTIARDIKQSVKYANKSLIRIGLLGMVSGLILIMAILISPLTRADNVTFNSARDCDSNAVMHCGAMTINELNNKYDNSASIKDIYDYFDITGKDINNMKQFAKAGKVQKNGNVLVNGKVVATNARTAGRMNIAGSTKVTHQGTTFYTRAPSVSFLSDSLDAYVIMENGAFSYAILASCGNPVSAKATAHPAYKLDKTVKREGGNWQENVDINYGETVEFRVVVKNTGNAPATNLHIRDRLPSQLTYVAGSLLRDGEPANATNFFSDTGVRIGRLPKGDSVVFRFRATTTQVTQPDPCVAQRVINRSHSEGGELPPQNDNASVDLSCITVRHPNYRIVKQVQRIGEDSWHESVTVPNGTNVRYRIVVSSIGDEPVTNLVIGDALPNGVAYVDNTLRRDNNIVDNDSQFFNGGINIGSLNPGRSTAFTFVATVGSTTPGAPCTEEQLRNVANADGDILEPILDDAIVTKQCPPIQRFSCDVLTATSLGDRNFRFNVLYTATGGATLSTATFSFDDNSPNFVTNLVTTTHQYAQDGTYNASVSLTFMVDGLAQTVNSEGCKITISSSTPPNHCTVPGKEHLLATDPNCDEENKTTEELPNTGPGSVLGFFAGSTIAGTLGYRKWALRRQKR